MAAFAARCRRRSTYDRKLDADDDVDVNKDWTDEDKDKDLQESLANANVKRATAVHV